MCLLLLISTYCLSSSRKIVLDSQGATPLIARQIWLGIIHLHSAIWRLLASQYTLDLVARWTFGCMGQPLVDAVCAECMSTGQRLGLCYCFTADKTSNSLFCFCRLWPPSGLVFHRGHVSSCFLFHPLWHRTDDLQVLMNDMNLSHRPSGPTGIIPDSCVHSNGKVSHLLVAFFGSCKDNSCYKWLTPLFCIHLDH